jgi:hypothetical protein
MYKEKYLKYKRKYIQLQNIVGGGYFKLYEKNKNIKFKTYSVMADISNDSIIDSLNQRRNCILQNINDDYIFHITLLSFEINRSLKPYCDLFENKNKIGTQTHKTLKPEIIQFANEAYNETFKQQDIILSQEQGKYHKMGAYYVKKYYIIYETQINTITEFRTSFYKKLRNYFRKNLGDYSFDWYWDETGNTRNDYTLAKIGNDVIFAIPNYYFGIGVLEPHISIAKEDEIKQYNPTLFYSIDTSLNPESEIVKYLLPHQFLPLSDIRMNKDIDEIRID